MWVYGEINKYKKINNSNNNKIQDEMMIIIKWSNKFLDLFFFPYKIYEPPFIQGIFFFFWDKLKDKDSSS